MRKLSMPEITRTVNEQEPRIPALLENATIQTATINGDRQNGSHDAEG